MEETPRAAVVLASREIKAILLRDLSNEYRTVVEMTEGLEAWFLVSLYLPPVENKVFDFEGAVCELERSITTLSSKGEVIIAGDLNARSRVWGSDRDCPRGRRINEAWDEVGMITMNQGTEPTFEGPRGSSNIDVTAATAAILARVEEWEVQGDKLTTTSDHKIITWTIARGGREKEGAEMSGWCAERADWARFGRVLRGREEALAAEMGRSVSTQQLDCLANHLTEAITSASDAAIPRRRRFPRSVPWWTTELTHLRAETRRTRKAFQKEKDPLTRQEKECNYRRQKLAYATRLEEVKKEKWAEFCRESTAGNPWGAVYRILRGRRRPRIRKTVQTDRGSTADAEETGEYLLGRFFPRDRLEDDDQRHKDTREEAQQYEGNGEREAAITEREVLQAVRSMGRKKAPGWDGITAEIAAVAIETIPGIMVQFYNRCLGMGHFPRAFKTAKMVPIPKAGMEGSGRISSYRPICLMPVLGKVLDSIMIERVQYWVGPESPSQYGFSKGRGTIDALEDVVGFLREARSDEDYCAAIFLDIKGAFDHAWWPVIKAAVAGRGCTAELYALLGSYLRDRSIEVEVAGRKMSRMAERGCPQGSRSGPGLWRILYGGLLEKEMPVGCRLVAFADDTTLLVRAQQYKTIKSRANQALARIEEWAGGAKLQFNPGKSTALFYGKSLSQARPPFRMGNQYIH